MNDKNSLHIFVKVNLSSYVIKFHGMNLINFLFYQINFLMSNHQKLSYMFLFMHMNNTLFNISGQNMF